MKKILSIVFALVVMLGLLATGRPPKSTQVVSSEMIYSATFVLTDAQTKALPTTAVEILPAAGENTIIFPLAFWVRENWSADYENIDGDASIHININGVDFGIFDESANLGVTFLLAGGGPDGINGYVTAMQSMPYPVASHTLGIVGMYDSDISNQPITIRAFNGSSGNFTGGDSANTLTITVLYTIITY